jgi:hypothetical protein
MGMTDNIADIEQAIAAERAHLDAWLTETYAEMNATPYYGELDIDFPDWPTIEKLVGKIFDDQLVQTLSPSAIQSLLFFIARNNEGGRLIAWLSPHPGKPLSNCGNLTYSDFLYLCDAALTQPDDDCDYELVSCFQKLESLDDGAISRLNRFFEKCDSYTRRLVLHTFAQFALPQTIDAAKILWETDDCEFAKLSCLESLKGLPEAQELFEQYLATYKTLFDVEAEDYRRSHIEQLSQK